MFSHTLDVHIGQFSYIADVSREACQCMHTYGNFEIAGTRITGLVSNQTTSCPIVLVGHVDHNGTYTSGAYSDLYGTWSGEVIHIVKFKITLARTIECYKQFPVLRGNGTYFLTPQTHILIRHERCNVRSHKMMQKLVETRLIKLFLGTFVHGYALHTVLERSEEWMRILEPEKTARSLRFRFATGWWVCASQNVKKSKIIRRFDGCCGQNICALVSIVQLPHARAEVRVSQMWRISIRAPRISLELSSEVKLQTVNGVTDVASLLEYRAVCLLSRRYDLIAMGYKFWEIGFNFGPPSYLETAMRDHCGSNCRCLSVRERASTS
ncbi:hypothetical protein ALC56_05880 [Trachymyrmex septentrionalis]|uniref:Uncharacterized protein n=1 Tax=Trachymyrmex septentrionalis TaxID=34720 RepID=A0A151JXK6_9HYME|nr:hypothetical protein ALC56_05880 [Trachymyrmex septentrionalis]